MTQEEKQYLQWRCRTNWHPKYFKCIKEWFSKVLPTQMDYFRIEMKHLIERGNHRATI